MASALHKSDVATAVLHYERVRHYRATRLQLGSKFAFDHLRAKDTAEQKALLEKIDERVRPAFAHDKRGGEDDSGKVYDITEWTPHHAGGAGIARMYAGKEATAEFGDYHSAEAVAHMAHFYIGDLVEIARADR